ncbi:hypothetical protein GE061_013904 [Apolygus lucorum]|uniref:Carboxypeptidase n=1 Tax=Apolygus lucorum TaxID=248454 RepID=A0A6A4JTI8_APOLU|nr:hypothetical protein GE061_013904 [Apolygus lucorum]
MKQFLVLSALWCLVDAVAVDFDSFINSRRNPLMLTPYILDGKIQEGRKAARVQPFVDGVESYSGFLTVNASSNGNLFFWYFPAENAPETAPVMIWLQGGPGCSSMVGLFMEHGPLQLNDDLRVVKRPTRWSQNIHMIYVDSPFGAGFSFSDPSGLAKNEREISTNLYNGLLQFFELFPELSENDFFVAGESYAGRYVPALADRIHRENLHAGTKINMKGLAIGDGVVDDTYKYLKVLGHCGKDDAIDPIDDDEIGLLLDEYLRRVDVQNRIHVTGTPFSFCNDEILQLVVEYDSNTHVAPWVEELLNYYPVLYYHGKKDCRLNYRGTVDFAKTLVWSGCHEYRSAEWMKWYVNGAYSGDFKTGGNLTVLLINDAHHLVPMYQPERAHVMIEKFVRGEPLMYV